MGKKQVPLITGQLQILFHRGLSGVWSKSQPWWRRILRRVEGRETPYSAKIGSSELQLAREAVEAVVGSLARKPSTREPKDRSLVPPSSAGKCAYQTLYEKLPYPIEPKDLRQKVNFLAGDIWERIFRYYLRRCNFGGFKFIETGDLVRKIRLGKSGSVNGYYDGIIEAPWEAVAEAVGGDREAFEQLVPIVNGKKKPHIRVLFEMKTRTEAGYRRSIDNSFGYRSQLGLYIRAAMESGEIDVPYGVFLLLNKNTNHCREEWYWEENLKREIEMADENYDNLEQLFAGKDLEKWLSTAEGRKSLFHEAGEILGKRPSKAGFDCFSTKVNEFIEVDALKGHTILLEGKMLGFQCGYCDHKYSCHSSRPPDRFEYNDDRAIPRHEPVWDEEPNSRLAVTAYTKKNQPIYQVVTLKGKSPRPVEPEREVEHLERGRWP